MFSIVSLIVLALLAWFVFRMLKRNRAAGAGGRDPLEHDRDGLNPPLPGQRAATEGEVHDAARSHVGGHLETGPDATNAGGTAGSLDASTAARAAEESRNTGGTGTAVLAGIATAAAAGSAAADSGPDTDRTPRADAEERVNAPDPETAGTLDVDASRAADEGTAGASAAADGADTPSNGVPTGERDPVRDDARTNAPVGDTSSGAAAREPVVDGSSPVASSPVAASPDGHDDPGDRVNAPDPGEAGAGALQDRSNDARSNLVAGTVSLGGATSAPGDAGEGLPSDIGRLANGDARENVREMLKILNLRASDASRLGISDEDFGRLWRGDADDGLVDDVGARLRRMIG